MERSAYDIMQQREGSFWWYVGMRRVLDGQLRRHAAGGKQNVILDAGCGTGSMFRVLANYGRVYGVDQSAQALHYARAQGIAAEVVAGSVTALPYGDAMFDVVHCADVLYHTGVESDASALQEFYRVLRPGGILIVREPAYDWLRGRQDKLVWTKHRFTKRELCSKVATAGFTVQKASYVNFFLLPLAIIKRWFEQAYQPHKIAEHSFLHQPLLNGIFTYILSAEALLLRYVDFPAGLSVMCIAKK